MSGVLHYLHPSTKESKTCECECGGEATSTLTSQCFSYGKENDAVKLTARVTVWSCSTCGFEWTDGDAEDSRHAAICQYLRLMSPAEIVEGRKRFNLTQAMLAKHTCIGEASIKRWESGTVFQNKSADMLLRIALQTEGGLALIKEIENDKQLPEYGQFRTTIPDSTKRQALEFKLRVGDR